MGYRSDVGAVFYVNDAFYVDAAARKELFERAKVMFDLWMQANMENCPEFFKGNFERTDGQLKFYAEDVKWYDGYEDVDWFNNFDKKFRDELCDNEQLDGGSGLNRCFGCEFVRIGEDLNDIVYESSLHSDNRLGINREMVFN